MGLFDELGQRIVGALEKALLPEELKAPIERGRKLLASGDYAAALLEFEAAHQAQPDYTGAIALMGAARLGTGDAEGALRDLEKAVTSGLNEPEVMVSLGRTYLALGRFAEAKAAFKSAGAKDPGSAAPLAGLGEAFLAEKRFGRAARELRKSLSRVEAEDRPELLALLGEALLRGGDLDGAVETLMEACTESEHDLRPKARARARIALGEAERKRRRWARAEGAYRAALAADPDNLKALLGLGGAQRGQGDLDGALETAGRAVEVGKAAPQALNLKGAVLYDKGRYQEALEHFRRALEHAPRVSALLRSATRASVALQAWSDTRRYAERLLVIAEDDPFGLAARGLAAVSANAEQEPARGDGPDLNEVRRELNEVLRHASQMPEALIGLARIALLEGATDEARVHATAALRVDPARGDARSLMTRLARRDLPPTPPSGDVAALAATLHATCAARVSLSELVSPVGTAREQLDRPLIVAVLGEFNAGKSTFVNALISEDIAPMGVTPTTATINLIKYGPERGARAIYRDGTTREIPFSDLKAFFGDVGEEAAREIEMVEVMYPIEELTRVNVVDTPGLNSLLEEHERVTRNYIAHADAVVWLFDVGQAGKLSEARVIDLVAGHGARTLGVLNKIDNVSHAERTQVLERVREEFGEKLVDVVPISAKQALKARLEGNESKLAECGFTKLKAVLDEQFFMPSRALVREGTRQRLRQLTREALRGAAQEVAGLDAATRALAASRGGLGEHTAAIERLAVGEATRVFEGLEEVYREAATEVLEFVKPRRSLWGLAGDEGSVDPEDRRYLLGLIEDKLTGIVNESRERSIAEVEEITSLVLAALTSAVTPKPEIAGANVARSATFASLTARVEAIGAELEARRAEMSAWVFGRYQAFSRGWLRGGRLDDFFDAALPRTDLVADEVHQALRRTMASPLVAAGDAGIALPLARWGQMLQDELDSRINEMIGELTAGRITVEAGTVGPLQDILRALE